MVSPQLPPCGEGIVLGLGVGVLPEEDTWTGTGLPEALPEVVRETRVQHRVHRGVRILQGGNCYWSGTGKWKPSIKEVLRSYKKKALVRIFF